jgi:hypothetical protein
MASMSTQCFARLKTTLPHDEVLWREHIDRRTGKWHGTPRSLSRVVEGVVGEEQVDRNVVSVEFESEAPLRRLK